MRARYRVGLAVAAAVLLVLALVAAATGEAPATAAVAAVAAPAPPQPSPGAEPEPPQQPEEPSPEAEPSPEPSPAPGPEPTPPEDDGDGDGDGENGDGSQTGTPQGQECGSFDYACRMQAAVNGWLAGIVADLVNAGLAQAAIAMLWTPEPTPGVEQGRTAALVVANTAYVLLVTLAGILVMANPTVQTSTSLKEVLPRLVLGFVAANASALLVGFLADVSNALVRALLGDAARRESVANAIDRTLQDPMGEMLVLVLLAVIAGVLVLFFQAAVIARTMLWLLLSAAAPLALACHALPPLEGTARLWWRAMGALLAIPIAQALALRVLVEVFLMREEVDLVEVGGAAGSIIDVLVLITALYVLVRIPFWAFKQVFGYQSSPLAKAARIAVSVLVLRNLGRAFAGPRGGSGTLAGAGPRGGGPRAGRPGGGRGPTGGPRGNGAGGGTPAAGRSGGGRRGGARRPSGGGGAGRQGGGSAGGTGPSGGTPGGGSGGSRGPTGGAGVPNGGGRAGGSGSGTSGGRGGSPGPLRGTVHPPRGNRHPNGNTGYGGPGATSGPGGRSGNPGASRAGAPTGSSAAGEPRRYPGGIRAHRPRPTGSTPPPPDPSRFRPIRPDMRFNPPPNPRGGWSRPVRPRPRHPRRRRGED
ncbi:hypothetical protein [Streptomonospora arabica]|uniref:Uncharacterized protein n=1 Tax=Streptomonospora arabica TaxID=412417 RepID=A0ABV9SHH3_9ACTN